ncbi:MAG: ACP phosphodiesterase [Flavobacteriales bacterium]|nr:ACP phosphodiesterase [Flavobacteriales bacterium]
MNYLAHVYLSRENIDLAIGNFIADNIKGNNYKKFNINWQKGILLHRFIDSYTDSHYIFREHSKLFFDSHRHYSRVLIDIFYDHFLAKNWKKYSHISLENFEFDFCKSLAQNLNKFPNEISNKIRFFICQKWFTKYSSIKGLIYILEKMDNKTQYESKFVTSIEKFISFAPEMESQFFIFFEDMINNVNIYFKKKEL